MLYTFFHEKAPRSLGLVYPPDWFDHVETGALSLLVVLHGGNQNITDFAATVRIKGLIKGDFHGDEKQKLIAIFPVGLSRDHDIGGSWASGHIGGAADGLGLDDVSFVFACVEFVDQMLVREMERQRVLGRALPIVESVFQPGRRFVMGFSNGAGMVARLLARRPGFFRAAAMHSHVFSGWKHTFQRSVGLTPADTIEANAPSGGDPSVSLIHLVGDADDRIMKVPGDTSIEGTPLGTTSGVDAEIGVNSTRPASDYYRYDEAIDASVAQWAVQLWINMFLIPAVPVLPFNPPVWVASPTGLYDERAWEGVYRNGDPAEVRQIMVFGLPHAWWFEDNDDNATKMFWDFFQSYAAP